MSDERPAGDPPAPESTTVVAAGGVVLEGAADARRVLVVHRPAYDDWSLPKGHVEPQEELADAALREVLEETGVRARVVAEAGVTEHPVQVADGIATKRVHWFTMRPTDDGDPAARRPDEEVDRAAWWPVEVALEGLTHVGERHLLARALGRD
jgi:8-oxo-dGTP diphosphatase